MVLHISPGGDDDNVSAEWLDSAHEVLAVFNFSLDHVNKLAEELRESACAWAASYEEKEKVKDDCWRELQELGVRCFDAIFNEHAEVITRSLSDIQGCTKIIVRHKKPKLLIPWGLICTSVDVSQEANTPFWGVKYNLVVDMNEFGSPINKYSDKNLWSFAAVVNKTIFTQTRDSLPSKEQLFANRIHDLSTDVDYSSLHSKQFRDKNHRFLYVYGHSTDDYILLIENKKRSDRVDPVDLLNGFVADNDRAVFFINACNTGKTIMSMGAQMASRIGNKEIVCIATEIPINHKFAMRFGLELIDRCLHCGEGIVDAMENMRKNHLPMSIAYTIYSRKSLKLMPSLQLLDESSLMEYRSGIEGLNFSKSL